MKYIYYYIVIILLGFSPVHLWSKTTNIYVDGAYNGTGGTMDKVIDERLKETRNQMERLDPNSENETVDTKDELLDALKKIECKCGDEINLFFFGHGGNEKLLFTKNNGSDRISAKNLAKALEEAAKECCCKINVVIMACHSGSMLEPLFEGEHIRSVYASSQDNECSYTIGEYDENLKFIDQGDWMRGFNSNLSAVKKGTSSAEAVAIASKSAKEKMPIQVHDKQHPQGWVKDTLDLWAHVQKEVKTERKTGKKYVEVLVYEPEHLRGQTKKIYLNEGEIPENLKECHWIKSQVDFNKPEEPIDIVGPITDAERPREKILAHVEKRHSKGKYIKVHTRRPNWMFCKEQKIHPPEGEKISKSVAKCLWIEQEVVIDNPNELDSIYDQVVPSTPKFDVKFHIEKINLKEGWAKVKITMPKWLNIYKYVIIPKEELSKWKKLRKCDNVWAEITMSDKKGGSPLVNGPRKAYKGKVKKLESDVAMNPADRPDYRSMSKVIAPLFTTTNTGNTPANYNVNVSISEIDISVFEQEISSLPIRDLVASFDPDHPFSNNYLLDEHFGSDMSNPIYQDQAEFQEVEAADSRDFEYRPFSPTPGKVYRILAKLYFEDDEVERNNHTQILFYVPEKKPLVLPKEFVFTASGTGRTTGHIITLSVHNTGDVSQSVTLGSYFIPSNGGYQPYIVVDENLISLLPNETTTIDLYGFCLDISLPPVPLGHPMLPIDQWLTPSGVGTIPVPSHPPGDNSPFKPITTSGHPDIELVYPGTDVSFPFKIDLNEHPKEAVPILYYATESLINTSNTAITQDDIQTPISSDPDKSLETYIQQNLWLVTSAMDPDEDDYFGSEDFEEIVISEIEKNTGKKKEELPPGMQSEINIGAQDLFSGILLVGTEAKVLKTKGRDKSTGTINTDKIIPDNYYKVVKVTGEADFKKPGGDWEKIQEGILITDGYSLATGYDCELLLIDNQGVKIFMNPLSEVSLPTNKSEIESEVKLEFGKIEVELKESGLKTDLKVSPPNASIAIRGTHLTVEYSERRMMTTVKLKHGKIVITHKNDQRQVIGPMVDDDINQIQITDTGISKISQVKFVPKEWKI